MNQKFVFSVGVGIFIRAGDLILVGRRGPLCGRGAGCWALPGGVIEATDTIASGALREVEEETGLAVQFSGGYPIPPGANPAYYDLPFAVPGLLAVTDHSDLRQQQDGNLLPHLTLWVMTAYAGGEPKVMEPGKCLGWEWKSMRELAKLEGCDNPTHPQYAWTPMPLWRKILRNYCGEF